MEVSFGQVIIGSSSSITIKLNEQAEVLPEKSVTVQVIKCVSTMKVSFRNELLLKLLMIEAMAAMGMMIFYTNAAVRIVYVIITKKILVRFQNWRHKTV